MNLAILKTEAVILKGWRFRETSKILSIYTKDRGKLRVIVKGAMGPKSKFKGCLETLSHIHIVYYHKATRDLQLISQVDLRDPHLYLLGNFERTTLSMAIAELVEKGVVGEEPFPQIFNLLVRSLDALNRGSGFLEGYVWYFESHFIDLMGYKPTWDCCLECKNSLGLEGGFFQPESGGLLCNQCGRGNKGGLNISSETLEILYWIQKAELGDAGFLNPSNSQKAEIRKMFDLYFRSHIEHMVYLKSLMLYYDMQK